MLENRTPISRRNLLYCFAKLSALVRSSIPQCALVKYILYVRFFFSVQLCSTQQDSSTNVTLFTSITPAKKTEPQESDEYVPASSIKFK